MHTIEHEPGLSETQVISPQVLQMIDALKAQGCTTELAIGELRQYSDSLWEDYRHGPEELQGTDDIEALAAAMEQDRDWSTQLYWLAHWIEKEGDIDEGVARFKEVEATGQELLVEPEWGADLKEVDDRARNVQVAAVWAALNGRPGIAWKERKEVKRELRGAQAAGMTATEYLESLPDFYHEPDVARLAEILRRPVKVIEAAMLGASLLLAQLIGGALETHSGGEPDLATAAQAGIVSEIVGQEESVETTITTLATTTTTAPVVTTSVPPLVTTTPPSTTTVPPVVYSQYQARLGARLDFKLNGEPVEYIVQKLQENTGENWDEAH